MVSVINLAVPPKGIEAGGAVNQSTTHMGASQNTLKGGSEAGALRAAVANQQQQAGSVPVEEEVARIRLKISAKATYSK